MAISSALSAGLQGIQAGMNRVNIAGSRIAVHAADAEVLATNAVEQMSGRHQEPVHDRMPVIVAPDHWQSWLAGMVVPYRDDELQAWPVSRRVSKTQDDDAGLIEPIEVPA
jgi:putative SOS response-associated peptidase YedK